MTKYISFLRSFQFRVTLLIIGAILFAVILCNSLIYNYTIRAQFENLRGNMMTIAQTSALMVDADKLMAVPLTAEGVQDSNYQEIKSTLQRIKDVNKEVAYIYTMTKTDKPGILQFIVDADPLARSVGGKVISSLPGQSYEGFRYSELMRAFEGPSADKKLERDEWGVFLSGYAPIRNQRGQAVAILGIDMRADDVYAIQERAKNLLKLVMLLGIVLAIFVGMVFSRKITGPIRQLVEGTRKISIGNLHHRVQVSGTDEISELAESFNRMAKNLYSSRQRVVRYFLRMFKTLIMVLDARDRYTKGHSLAVAEHAAQIAFQMGIPKEKVKVFKKLVTLHDIGKIAISDNILNKPGQLTEEEWKIIREHPVIGEEILKPILEDKEFLTIARNHHERYDGAGYPDKLKGDDIHIFAAIVSVADAYHAMTSDRVYRKALTKEQATAELVSNRGTQFHPRVVDIFLQILKEEI